MNAEQEAQARAEREARIRSHNQEGFQALSEGRFSGALDAWHSSLELEPEQPRILSNLALLQARTGDLEAALEQAARAVQLEPTSPALSVNYGLLLEADDRGAEAVAHYRRALDLDATFKPAWLALGARALAAGDPVEAERHYSDALQHHPRSAEAMAGWASAAARMGRWDEAAARMEEAFELTSKQAVWAAAAGALYFRSEAPDDAVRMLDAALALDAQMPDALVLRAELAWLAEDYARARELYTKAVNLDEAGPDRAGSSLRYGELAMVLDRPDLAGPALQEVLVQEEQPVEWRARALARLGVLALERDDFDEALDFFEAADEEASPTGLTLAGRARAYHGLAWQGRIEEREGVLDRAEALYREALDREENTRLRLALSRLYMQRAELVEPAYRRGQLHQAEVQLGEVLREQPGMVEAHLRLARLYEQLERVGDARVHYQKVLELDPLSSRSIFLYANMLRRQAEAQRDRALRAEAHRYFRRAMELDPAYVAAQVGWYLTRSPKGQPPAERFRAGVDPDPSHQLPAPEGPDSDPLGPGVPESEMEELPPELESLLPFLESHPEDDPFIEDPFDDGFGDSPDTIPIKENDMDPLYRIEGSNGGGDALPSTLQEMEG